MPAQLYTDAQQTVVVATAAPATAPARRCANGARSARRDLRPPERHLPRLEPPPPKARRESRPAQLAPPRLVHAGEPARAQQLLAALRVHRRRAVGGSHRRPLERDVRATLAVCPGRHIHRLHAKPFRDHPPVLRIAARLLPSATGRGGRERNLRGRGALKAHNLPTLVEQMVVRNAHEDAVIHQPSAKHQGLPPRFAQQPQPLVRSGRQHSRVRRRKRVKQRASKMRVRSGHILPHVPLSSVARAARVAQRALLRHGRAVLAARNAPAGVRSHRSKRQTNALTAARGGGEQALRQLVLGLQSAAIQESASLNCATPTAFHVTRLPRGIYKQFILLVGTIHRGPGTSRSCPAPGSRPACRPRARAVALRCSPPRTGCRNVPARACARKAPLFGSDSAAVRPPGRSDPARRPARWPPRDAAPRTFLATVA
ncbi:hypothetical protein FGB62_28g24 [Gracilaria domingensis]|nr:hypothetical protein FGB62_28g24 [Gracilaria domingensis]